MIILKKYKGSERELKAEGTPVDWFETTEAECLDHTEQAGYWKSGSVIPMLRDGYTVQTPFASYKKA